MVKRILVSVAVATLFGGCMSGAGSSLSSVGSMAVDTFSSSQTASTSSATSQGSTKCVGRMSGGSTSFTQMVTKEALSYALSTALKEVSGDKNIKAPQRITNTCEADKRLAYLKKIANAFSDNLDSAQADILASLEQTKEVQKLQAQREHKKKTLEAADYKTYVSESNEEFLKLEKQAKVKDKKKYSEAMGKLAIATPILGYTVLGWDKEILEFAQDNMMWGISNVGAVKDIASQAVTIVKVLPTLTSLVTTPHYKGRVDQTIAKKAAKEEMKSDAKILKNAEDEF
jgi:hypothetical protein